MGNSKHIFIQVDTDGIILLKNQIKKSDKKEAEKLVRAHTIICDQGSMSLGNPVKYFTIHGNPRQTIHFSIVPIQLFSNHKLYFNGFTCEKSQGINIPEIDSHQLSFKIQIEEDAVDGNRTFCLHAVLEYDGQGTPILINIDPVIQIQQPD